MFLIVGYKIGKPHFFFVFFYFVIILVNIAKFFDIVVDQFISFVFV